MKLGWKGVLGLAISAVALWYALRGIDMSQVGQVLRNSNWPLLLLSAAVATMVFPLRALRWRVLLEPVADVPYPPLWRSVAIGMMVNNLAPARAGELARAFALTRETPAVNFATAFGSLALDRIIDAVVIVVLLVVALFTSGIPPETTVAGWSIRGLAWTTGALAAGALTGVTLIVAMPQLVLRIFDAVVQRLAPRWHERLRRILESLIAGLGALRSPTRLVRITGWALALWLTNALSFYIAFVAVGIEAPFMAAVLTQSLIALAVAAPSSPGFVGVFELSAVEGLSLFGVPRDLAFSWGLGYHTLSFLPITLIGLYYFARLGMSFRDLGQPREATA